MYIIKNIVRLHKSQYKIDNAQNGGGVKNTNIQTLILSRFLLYYIILRKKKTSQKSFIMIIITPSTKTSIIFVISVFSIFYSYCISEHFYKKIWCSTIYNILQLHSQPIGISSFPGKLLPASLLETLSSCEPSTISNTPTPCVSSANISIHSFHVFVFHWLII